MKDTPIDPHYSEVDEKIKSAILKALQEKGLYENCTHPTDMAWCKDRVERYEAVIAGLVAVQMLGEKLFQYERR